MVDNRWAYSNIGHKNVSKKNELKEGISFLATFAFSISFIVIVANAKQPEEDISLSEFLHIPEETSTSFIDASELFNKDEKDDIFSLRLEDKETTETSNEEDDNESLTAGVTTVMANIDNIDIGEVSVQCEEDPVIEEEEPEEIKIIDCTYKEIEPYKMYVGDTFLRARSEPYTEDDNNIVGVMKPGKIITVIGEREDGWVVINFKDQKCFVASEFLEIKKPVSATYNWTWSGAKLNRHNGIISGPSGNETYYNLDMSRVVSIMRAKGYNYEAWVREDGVKMFGDYIMCAANLRTRPKGTIIESSLGDCIVVDTGSFVTYDPNRLDIATTW